MQSKSIYKIPNGKLIKIFLEFDKNLIKNISITGDFFAYPEEAIEIIENELKNTILNKKILYKKIDYIIKKNNFEFIGITAEGLTEGIFRCLK
jgi:lipoate-protein ligase A